MIDYLTGTEKLNSVKDLKIDYVVGIETSGFCLGTLVADILNLPFVRVWVQLLKIPRPYLYGGIVTLALLGAYALNSSTFDLQIALAIGILGFLFRRFGVPLTPLIIGLIMGPLAEVQFKRALQISNGDYGILIEGFLPKALYTLMFILLLLPVIYKAINKRKQRELVS